MDDVRNSGSSSTPESLLDILKEIKKEKVDDDYDEAVFNIPYCEVRKKQCNGNKYAEHLYDGGRSSRLNAKETNSAPVNLTMVTKIKEEDQDGFLDYGRIRRGLGADYINSIAKRLSVSDDIGGGRPDLQSSEATIENLVLSVNIYIGKNNVQFGPIDERIELVIKISNRLIDDDITDGLVQTLPAGLGASQGVYTTCFLPDGTVFEPYQESVMGEIQCTRFV